MTMVSRWAVFTGKGSQFDTIDLIKRRQIHDCRNEAAVQ